MSDLESIQIKVNPDRLRQSIVNVLENASKYSPETKPIELSMAVENQNVYFDIKDYGTGIPEEDHQAIFQPFRRSGSDAAGVPGSGVGLALVFQLVKLMNGRIYVLRSSSDGTVMRFEFPVA